MGPKRHSGSTQLAGGPWRAAGALRSPYECPPQLLPGEAPPAPHGSAHAAQSGPSAAGRAPRATRHRLAPPAPVTRALFISGAAVERRRRERGVSDRCGFPGRLSGRRGASTAASRRSAAAAVWECPSQGREAEWAGAGLRAVTGAGLQRATFAAASGRGG